MRRSGDHDPTSEWRRAERKAWRRSVPGRTTRSRNAAIGAPPLVWGGQDRSVGALVRHLPLWALALAACSAPAASSPAPLAPATQPAPAAAPAPAKTEAEQQAERLAAIQHAMNQLDEGAQQCWAAAAAVEGVQLAGDLTALVDIAAPRASVQMTRNTSGSARLSACVAELLARYPWAPPLAGQAISLPFAFRAPSGQSVIDRRFVPAVAQGAVAIATLLDERNTGNPAASMFEVTVAAGASTGLRVATRTEAWYFLGAGEVGAASGARGEAQRVAGGDVLLVPAGTARKLEAAAGAPLRAVLVVTPGGVEGSARAGALPTPEAPLTKTAPAAAFTLVRATDAKRYPRPGGEVSLLLDPATTKQPALSAALLSFAAGAAVPLHQHAAETELLYILEGAGTLTVGEATLPVEPTSVLQLPRGVPHAFVASAPLRALQLYTPAGPEQRFKAPAAARP